MSVSDCSHCGNPYWRFRRDHPPSGYCSVTCFEARRSGKKKPEPPALPQDVLMLMYRHRLQIHNSTSILADFDCEECERMEGVYAESLSWHQMKAERELRQEETKRRRVSRRGASSSAPERPCAPTRSAASS